jgi:type VI secretion system protein ImpH
MTVEDRLYAEGYAFDFFQAVRVLGRLFPERQPVGHGVQPRAEVARFRVHLDLGFPASAIYEVEPPAEGRPLPTVTVTFLGLTGPSGTLPRHYTELLLRLKREGKGPERWALHDWLDLFNHRLIALFYRAWEKYRFFISYERGDYRRPDADPFTRCLFSLVGLGEPALRDRLRVAVREEDDDRPRERVLARIDDLALLYYSGFLAHRPRCASALEEMLGDYFGLPVAIEQFQGQWLRLDPANQSGFQSNNVLGMNCLAGERVWDIQGKFRVRVGPLGYDDFVRFLPDRTPVPERKALFLLSHLVRLFVGPELDFEIQLVLKAAEVPACQLGETDGLGPRLGWNTWAVSRPRTCDADEAIFDAQEVVFLDDDTAPAALQAELPRLTPAVRSPAFPA